MKLYSASLSLVAVLSLASPSAAQDASAEFAAGRSEYLSACAACHGDAADGKGPIAAMFKRSIPNLTEIAVRNDGSFPLLKVFQIIDGRSEVPAHGSPMPVFGNRYAKEATDSSGYFGSESIVRARVLELVYYLQSIQK